MTATQELSATRDVPASCQRVWEVLAEVPAEGPVTLIPNRLTLVAIHPRNRECILRLAALAERLEPSQVK